MNTSSLSPVFYAWKAEFITGVELDESTYDQALRVAEKLKTEGLINQAVWLEMVWQANAALVFNAT